MGAQEQTPPVLDGWVITGDKRTAVQVRFASRYSLWAELDHQAIDGEIENLELVVGEKVMELGRCRVVQDPAAVEALRRVVPISNNINFEKLFFAARIETLESAALNLPLILSYKEKIDPAFREFVSGLTYDLNVYKNLLDRMDAECEGELPAVRELVQMGIIDSVGPEFTGYLDDQLEELGRIVSSFSEAEHEHHGFYFRRQLWSFLMTAPLLARTNVKPRGYSGDSEMMRMIYLNDYQGDSTFGRLLHKHALGVPAAQCVRNRRVDVSRMIRRFVSESSATRGGRGRVMSVACGPAMEVRDILQSTADAEQLHFSLLDQDQQALLEAAGMVAQVEKELGASVSVDFIRESVRTMLVTRQPQDRWGRFHFIYSMGLFDYLTTPVAGAVLKKLYRLLQVNGEMAIGNLYAKNPNRWFMEYWLDWKIFLRTGEEFLELAADLPGAESEILFDETGIQMFLHVRKRKADA